MRFSRILITGKVQGVGFRPCVYKIAKSMGVYGYVRNLGSSVEILISHQTQEFLKKLQEQKPVHSEIKRIDVSELDYELAQRDFIILHSDYSSANFYSAIPQDLKICKDCLRDIRTKSRFKDYAFTTCTNCGPRYSLILTLPYDRKNTSMRDFCMCQECRKEYENPNDRRFHAQPISCVQCRIPLSFEFGNQKLFDIDAVKKCAGLINEGKIVAIKGVGGFALCCKLDFKVIQRLRKFKNRPYKPFAIMAKDTEMAGRYALINELEKKILESPQAPIVLLKKRQNLENVAPFLKKIGIVLPYSGLHFLLFDFLSEPIIFTSANYGSDPIITDKKDLFVLSEICDGILDYDRKISQGIDDSVVEVVDGIFEERIQILRLARGYAPLHLTLDELDLGGQVRLAMGADLKNTFAFAKKSNVIISPYLGDLGSPETLKKYEKTIDFFSHLYQKPEIIISDLHQSYHSYKISANKSMKESLLWKKEQHHIAHFRAIFIDSHLQNKDLSFTKKVLGVIFDGTGKGFDETIWGGEFFVGNFFKVERAGYFMPTKIYGGERSLKEIYRIAYCFAKAYASVEDFLCIQKKFFDRYPQIMPAFDVVINQKISFFETSSVGRIFDAVTSLCGICDENTYEAQGAMMLENYLDDKIIDPYGYEFRNGMIDISKFFKEMIHDIIVEMPLNYIITRFFSTLSYIVLDFAKASKIKDILFSGGVFLNSALCKMIEKVFWNENQKNFNQEPFRLYFHHFFPSNDSNIALGQIASGAKVSL